MTASKFEKLWKILSDYNFEINDDISTEILCIICGKIMIDPHTSSCGCHYCFRCISEHIDQDQKYCPGKKSECSEEYLDFDNNLIRDVVIRRKISFTKVKCLNELCVEKVEIGTFDEHIRICPKRPKKCPYEMIGCVKEGVREDNIKDHIDLDKLRHSEFLVKAINHLRNEMNELKETIKIKDLKMNELEKTVELNRREMKEEIDKNKNEIEIIKENIQLNEVNIPNIKVDELKIEIEEIKKKVKKIAEYCIDMKLKNDEFEEEIEEKNIQLFDVNLKIFSVKKDIENIEKACDIFMKGTLKNNKETEEIKNEVIDNKNKIKEIKKEFNGFKNETNKNYKELSGIKIDNISNKKEMKAMKKEFCAMKKSNMELLKEEDLKVDHEEASSLIVNKGGEENVVKDFKIKVEEE